MPAATAVSGTTAAAEPGGRIELGGWTNVGGDPTLARPAIVILGHGSQMTSTHTVTLEQKQAAEDAVIQALRALQAPSASLFNARSDVDILTITEPNRKTTIRHLLRAVTCLIPADHPDAPLRAEVERWIKL